MKYELARHHFSRRDALKLGAAGAAAAATGTALTTAAEAADATGGMPTPVRAGSINDEMFDLERVIAGGFWQSPYGPDDTRGSYNEVTAERTARSLRVLDAHKPVNTYQMGEEMFNGFPAFPSAPPRLHDMFLLLFGYDAGEEFAAGGGIQSGTDPLGPNRVVGFEERFAENFTFQIATQIDGLGHVGIGTGDERGAWFYNDNYGNDMISPTGLKTLGNESMGPVVTRGIIYDIVGLKVAQGHTDDFFIAPNGKPVLRDNYRITVNDLEKAARRQRVFTRLRRGDVPIIHTGWTHLVKDDPNRYLTQEPGIYLSESRWFASHRPAMVATDTWGLEVLDPEVTGGNAFPCHQELFGKFGIRIGESFVSDAAIEDHCYEGVLITTPENVPGATCGSAPPAFLGQPGRAPND